jgi:hypothetical protein
VNPEYKAKWVAALRSGQYQQAQKALKSEGGFCCLGVLCDVMRADVCGEWDEDDYFVTGSIDDSYLPDDVATLASVDCDVQNSLVDMNDKGATFSAIADYIERTL